MKKIPKFESEDKERDLKLVFLNSLTVHNTPPLF